MGLVYDGTRTAKNGGGWIERADMTDWISRELPQLRADAAKRLQDSQNRWHTADKFAWGAVAAPYVAAAAPAILGGGAAAGAGSVNGLAITPYASTAAMHAPAAVGSSGMGFSLGKLLGSRGFETVANGVTGLLGMRAQNNANRYATDTNARLMADQTRLEQERIARQEAADAADRLDAERRWNAEQAFKAKEFDASEEERAYNRKLLEDREARRAVFRPYSESALRSLGAILGLRS